MKSCKMQSPDYLLFEFLFQLLHKQIIIIFTNFQNFLQHYLKKKIHLLIFSYNKVKDHQQITFVMLNRFFH